MRAVLRESRGGRSLHRPCHLLTRSESLAHELAKLAGHTAKTDVVSGPAATSETVSKLLMKVQEDNYADVDRLNAKLRKEFDAAKAANLSRMRELQRVTAELSHVERMVQSDRAEGGATSRDKGIQELEAKIDAVQQQCQVRAPDAPAALPAPPPHARPSAPLPQAALHQSSMFDFMAARLRGETKDMEVRIEGISEELKVLATEHEEAALALHTTTAQKLRTTAVGSALARHLESERASRDQKLARLRATLAEQQARMQDFDEREARRQTMSGTVAQSDLDEDGEDRLKQLFLVRKIYNNMLTRRLRDDQRRTDKLANAYQRIRAATGLDDVDAIVSKFRTRDSTFASLQAQMKSARDRVDALLAERRALVWALDEARTTGATALEVRALYNNVEEADRRIAEANRRSREARERCHRLNVLLEECRACVAKLLDRVGCDSSVIAGVVADLAALDAEAAAEAVAVTGGGAVVELPQRRGTGAGGSRRNSADEGATPGGAASPLARRHERLVSAEQLGDALSTLEQRVGQLLAHLAGVFEREEVLVATTAKAKGGAGGAGACAAEREGRRLPLCPYPVCLSSSAAKVRRAAGGGAAAGTTGGTLAGGGGSAGLLLGALDAGATVTESDAAAHRMSVATLTDKAAARVFLRLMTLAPDTSDRNVRVHAKLLSPESRAATLSMFGGAVSGGGGTHAAGGDGGGGGAGDLDAAMAVSAVNLTKLLKGTGASAVVDRNALKRLSAMVSSSLTGTMSRQAAPGASTSPRPGTASGPK